MKLFLYSAFYFLRYCFNLFVRKRVYSNHVSFSVKIGEGSTISRLATIDSETIIGRYTYIGVGTCITKATIGSYCSIANNVSIGQGEHDLNRVSTSESIYQHMSDFTKDDCVIGNDVWIGVGSCILRGVKIGNGAVIGAGAVVTKDVLPFSVVVGVPAKIIKYRFSEEKIKRIEKSNWWNHELSDSIRIVNEFENDM